MSTLPRYPVYVVSKGRSAKNLALTARFLLEDGVPFHVVVEPPEYDDYVRLVGEARVLKLPFHDLGLGSIPARNWIWEHSAKSGAARHWILDDNIVQVERMYTERRLRCASGAAFAAAEDFVDRFENVGLGGLAYHMFAPSATRQPPYRLNCHVYSCILILNALPYRWRGRYNEDTDLCLQTLSGGWCIVQVNTFLALKVPTMTMKGGNTDVLYRGDGRLKMARSLERMWPGVVKVDRRFNRPQHVVDWTKFTTPLRRKPDVDFEALGKKRNEYGLVLRAVGEVKHPADAEMLRRYNAGRQRKGAVNAR